MSDYPFCQADETPALDAEANTAGAEDGESHLCPVCGGSGEVAGDYFADDGMTICENCSGTGKV